MINKIFNVKVLETGEKSRNSIKTFILKYAEPYGLTDIEVEEIIFNTPRGPIIKAGLYITIETQG